MSWTQLIGYVREKKLLQKAIIEERLPGAYLFSGTDGIGKDAFAIQFAKTVNCKSPLINEVTYDSCNKCSSCKKFNDLSHENLFFVFSLPSSGKGESKSGNPFDNYSDDQIEDIRRNILQKGKDPYFKIDNGATQIKISAIRHLKKKLSLSDSGKGRRVVIISNADEMTEEASNSFLKTLEEPHDNVTIILTTSKPNRILQTILSRCQQINFGPLSIEDITNALIKKNGFSYDEALLASAFGQGSYRLALESADDNIKERRDIMINLLRTIVKKKYRIALLEQIDEITKDKNKKTVLSAITLLQLWIRDAYLLQKYPDNDNLINSDQKDVISKFANYYKDVHLEQINNLIEQSITSLYKNVNQKLILLRLYLLIRELLVDKK